MRLLPERIGARIRAKTKLQKNFYSKSTLNFLQSPGAIEAQQGGLGDTLKGSLFPSPAKEIEDADIPAPNAGGGAGAGGKGGLFANLVVTTATERGVGSPMAMGI